MKHKDAPKNKGQWPKGTSGNPSGRPPGSRNKATLAMEALLEGEAEQLTRKAIEMALEGETFALRLCLERLLPARKDRPIELNLPPVQSAKQISEAMGTVVAAVSEGQITPNEGRAVADMLAVQSEFVEAESLEERVSKLEQKQCLDFVAGHPNQLVSEMEEDDPEYLEELKELGDYDDAA
jgi:Family of unknown function (DUF5681)